MALLELFNAVVEVVYFDVEVGFSTRVFIHGVGLIITINCLNRIVLGMG